MSDHGAYKGEMTDPFVPTDDELDGVYAGVAPADDLQEVAAFMLEVKATCAEAPRTEVAARHIAAMVEQAGRAEVTRPLNQRPVVVVRATWRKVMERTMSTVLKGAAGVLAASMSMMGLAYAGVDLPGEAAANAIEAVTGVDLPNQSENEKSVADDVKAVVESDTEKGCEFGQAVAAAASQNAQGDRPDEDRCADDGEGDSGEARGSSATGTEKSAAGRAKAAEKSAAGRSTAAEKSDGASDAGAGSGSTGADNASTGTDRASRGSDNASSGKATAEEESSGAGTAGSDAGGSDDTDGASEGLGTASEMSGGASEAAGGNADRRP